MATSSQLRPRFGVASTHVLDCWVPLAALALAFVLGAAVAGGHPPALDRQLLDWVGAHITGLPQAALVTVYRLTGKAFTPVLVLAAILVLTLQRRWRDLALLCASTGGILLLVDLVLKPHFLRSRPPGSLIPLDGHSFPSGHAAGSIAFYVAMVVILSVDHPRRRWPLTLLAGAWVALIWLSNLVARAHWPSDLIAGGAVGLAWLSLCLAGWRRMCWPPRR
ncbi:MAG: phosphatase PAP2 family protein [Cyanobacteriota bacterium]